MATQCLRRPISSTVSLVFRLPERRAFTKGSAQLATFYEPQQPRAHRVGSMRIQAKEEGQIPSDVGLFPDTFITPSGMNRPSVFREPRTTLQLYMKKFMQTLRNSLQVILYRIIHRKSGVKLEVRQIKPTAVALHKRMYTAFAEGDLSVLKKNCADGLYTNFSARINARGKEKAIWELLKYNKPAKLMSYRAASLPLEGSGMKQAVVKISSRQKLTRYAPNGTQIKGSGQEKDVLEYVVIQKRMLRWQEDEWIVWGTTQETPIEKD